MKKLLSTLMLFFGMFCLAQVPERISYQAIIRDASGQLIKNQSVAVRVSVLYSGTAAYSERLTGVTNTNGLLNLEIGGGTPISGTFNTIDWSKGSYYLKTETDPTGGTNYNTITGTSQLLSVPYAMYAKSSGNGGGNSGWSLVGNTIADTDFMGTINDRSLNLKINNEAAGKISKTGTSYGYRSNTGTGEANTAIGNGALLSNTTGPNNTAVGFNSLSLNTVGYENTSVGTYSLAVNTTGLKNTAVGNMSLYSNTTGYKNTAVGNETLLNSSTGSGNTAIGSAALSSNTTGSENTAIGLDALSLNTTGAGNVATGSYTLNFNTTGETNTANGYKALYSNTAGNSNVAIGTSSLYNNTTGKENTAIGTTSLAFNTSGSNNTASGFQALYKNTTGAFNVATGKNALYSNTTGNYNTAIGTSALYLNKNGMDNTATGNDAMFNNTGGIYNTATGSGALYSNDIGGGNTAIGRNSLDSNITGGDNTAVGMLSLDTNTNGVGNTGIGYLADVSTGTLSNATAIGYKAIVNASNKVRIGNDAVTVIEGKVPFSNTSDARFKYNIKPNVPGLDFISKLVPVTYYFDEEKLEQFTKTGKISNNNLHSVLYTGDKVLHTGFLAQDVERIAKTLGYSFDGVRAPASEKEHYSLAYSQFIMPLVKGMQEQQMMIDAQSQIIQELIKKVNDLSQKVNLK